MYKVSKYQMHKSADASFAPACPSARMNSALNLDTAALVVSILILAVLVLLALIVRIGVPL